MALILNPAVTLGNLEIGHRASGIWSFQTTGAETFSGIGNHQISDARFHDSLSRHRPDCPLTSLLFFGICLGQNDRHRCVVHLAVQQKPQDFAGNFPSGAFRKQRFVPRLFPTRKRKRSTVLVSTFASRRHLASESFAGRFRNRKSRTQLACSFSLNTLEPAQCRLLPLPAKAALSAGE